MSIVLASRITLVTALLSTFSAAAQAFIPASTAPSYSQADLDIIQQRAADRAMEFFPNAVIAIVDRDGRELVLRRANGTGGITETQRAIAVSKAGTAVFLSSNEQSFTPRTAGFIIQQHFPPGVQNRPPGPLVGVGFSNLAFSDINYFRAANGTTRIPGTRLYASPGGVPLYKNGRLFAGIGVTGDLTESENSRITGADQDEAIALAGQIGYAPDPRIVATNVLIDGIRIPYVNTPARAGNIAGAAPVIAAAAPPAPVVWPTATLGSVTGQVRSTIIADPLGGNGLSLAEVTAILTRAADQASKTRAGIRLPLGRPAQVFISVVNNPGPTIPPAVLGTFRTPDATLFSWDVSVQKARTVVYYTNANPTCAFSSRAVGFIAQSNYPPGIDGNAAGRLNGEQAFFSGPLLTGAALNEPELPNGITIFPGGLPIYRNGQLIGAIGVSGDGIDQDDLIAAWGAYGGGQFLPPDAIRSDFKIERGARLPFAKFPRDPQLRGEARPYLAGP